ncbi:MAG: GNAT family N-acetyltransferase [Actinomycetota bacterium]
MVRAGSEPRFAFEPLAHEDLPFLIEVRNECRNSLHDNRVFTLAECETWFREESPDFHVIRYGGERIGYFRLSHHDPENASIYVGADLHKRFRGRGLARPAYEAFLPLVKDRHRVSIAQLEVLSHNTVALALYRSLGFAEIDRKKEVAVRAGTPVDSIVMAKKL